MERPGGIMPKAKQLLYALLAQLVEQQPFNIECKNSPASLGGEMNCIPLLTTTTFAKSVVIRGAHSYVVIERSFHQLIDNGQTLAAR